MFNLYDYNTRSEVVDAVRYFGSSTNSTENPVGLQDWSYAYDPAKRGTGNIPLRPVERDYAGQVGNRTGTTKANASADYTANALNQYTERTVPDSSDILGSAETNVTVTVNTNTATRQDYYWYHRLEVDNLYTAAYPQVVVEAVFDPGTNDPYVVSSETGNVFVAASPEEFTYDDDGNLLTDGRFEYAWDAENRLISAETIEGLLATVPIVHVEFEYDYMSRRTAKNVYEWDEGITNWAQIDSRTFVYDGWLLVQEQSDSGGNTSTNFYVHGLDVSGSLQGAGGIGGLIASIGGAGSPSTPVFYTFDGNGNVSEIVSTNGTILAHYQYSPFGETIVATGELADENKFRFSTKYFCDEFGMGDWGRRWYSLSMARFITSDPIGRRGGANLQQYARNNSVSHFDYIGLVIASMTEPDVIIGTPAGTHANAKVRCECFILRNPYRYSLACHVSAEPVVQLPAYERAVELNAVDLYNQTVKHEFARVGQIISFLFEQKNLLEEYEEEYCPEKTCTKAKTDAEKSFEDADARFTGRGNARIGSEEEDEYYNVFIDWLYGRLVL